MTWFKFAVGTFYIFVKWVSSSQPSMYSFQINCLVLLGSSYFLLDYSYVAYAKLHFTFFRWSCRMMPSTVYYIWKQLGTGIGYTVPGDTALYPAVPKIPGTYRAQHWIWPKAEKKIVSEGFGCTEWHCCELYRFFLEPLEMVEGNWQVLEEKNVLQINYRHGKMLMTRKRHFHYFPNQKRYLQAPI